MTTININAFINAVKTEMESRLYDYELTRQDIVKMNDITMHGLVARRTGENTGATVYLDEAFSRFLNGYNLIDIADEVAEVVLEAENHKPITADSDIDLSFDAIKDMLTLRLVDVEKNVLYLTEHPHRDIGAGLAVIAEINVGNDYSIIVTNDMAKDYDIDELFDTALDNMQALYPAQMISLEEAIFGDGRNVLESNEENIEGLYTLMTDGMHSFGASALAYRGLTERIRKLFGSPFYILPSSVHEIILLKDDGTADTANLKEMVEQANRSVVAPPDVLSDNVFHFGADGLRRVA